METQTKSSTHKLEVVRLGKIDSIPGADNVGITHIWGQHQVVIRKADWKEGDLAGYIVPDSLVPTDHPEFSFLKERPESKYTIDGKEYHRIRCIRLRKCPSEGMLVPVPVYAREGDDLADRFGIKRYEPPEPKESRVNFGGKIGITPPGETVKRYGVESYKRYSYVMSEDERVVITEKIHGCNARFTYRNGKLWVGSHNVWRKGDETPKYLNFLKKWDFTRKIIGKFWKDWTYSDYWWRVTSNYPQIEEMLKTRPGWTLYGEIYGGGIQELTYNMGLMTGFAAFDLANDQGTYQDYSVFDSICKYWRIPSVPVLYTGAYSDQKIKEYVDGPTVLGKGVHIREGIVVKPTTERYNDMCGRVVLKVISNNYLEM